MASPYNGLSSGDRWENLGGGQRGRGGMSTAARIASGVAGAALLALSLRRRRLRPLVIPFATGLLSRAVSGKPALKLNKLVGGAGRQNTSPVASVRRGQGIKVEHSVIINRPVVEVYRFWRNFENLPRFMDHLESVTVLDENTSHWVAKGPAGTRIEWDAVIHNEMEDELIAWRTRPGAEVSSAGSVHFTPVGRDATEVRVVLSYDPPAGRLGAAFAKLFGEEPSQQIEDDLRRLKQVMDAGDAVSVPAYPAHRP